MNLLLVAPCSKGITPQFFDDLKKELDLLIRLPHTYHTLEVPDDMMSKELVDFLFDQIPKISFAGAIIDNSPRDCVNAPLGSIQQLTQRFVESHPDCAVNYHFTAPEAVPQNFEIFSKTVEAKYLRLLASFHPQVIATDMIGAIEKIEVDRAQDYHRDQTLST